MSEASSVRMQGNYELTLDSASSGAMVATAFVTTEPDRGTDDHLGVHAEILIWPEAFGGAVSVGGKDLGIVEVGGRSWRLFVAHPADWLGGTYDSYSFIATSAPTSRVLDLDLVAFVKALNQATAASAEPELGHALVPDTAYLASAEIGPMIRSGVGSISITGFQVSVQKK